MNREKGTSFWVFYGILCGVLLGMTMAFGIYVWQSIALYEKARPEHLVEETLAAFGKGQGFACVQYPQMPEHTFSSADSVREQYQDILQTAPLTYQFVKEDYQTGQSMYYVYAEEEAIGKLTLETQKSEKRLGIMQINHMEVLSFEPILDVATWEYDFVLYDNQKLYVNDQLVPDTYLTGEKQQVERLKYVYEYTELPYQITYHMEALYQKPEVRIEDRNGKQVEFEENGNQIVASLSSKQSKQVPEEIAQEIDVQKAAETWSLFTTKDLSGANYGLQTVRKYFIKDSYLWKKLGEYAHGVDITLVSDHARTQTRIDEEQVTEFEQYTENCFSCRIMFLKHMWLKTGKEQIDQTDSYFYFVKIDDTEDEIDNPTWKIADIQAAVNAN